MLKKIVSLSLAVLMVLAMNTTAFAASPKQDHDHEHEHVSVGDFIHTETGSDVVIRVNEDQSFYTAPLRMSFINPRDCSHTNLQSYGNPMGQTKSYNKSDSTYCYKYRTVKNARCLQCGKTGFKIYGSWEKHKHSYSLFSSKCKKCGYEK
ncbi:hypothetical protein [Clostridium sp. E02]|uniref:hypothetical protein n=1 Tax=Clostridium sp. E02 TaxID=2487134 RepID=UPI000F5344FA|nr:hypothetical protein [Clostridium sp. E02]